MRNAYRVPAADYDTHSSKLIARSHDDYHRVLVCLYVGNAFGERICWKILRGDDRTRCLDDEPERHEIGSCVVGRLLVERLTPGMSAAVAAEARSPRLNWSF
jgi:hypothetical protein